MTSTAYVCMYVRKFITGALKQKVTVAPRSQTNRNVFSARLNRSVDKSAERREDGRLFQTIAPATAKLRSPNVLLVRRTTNVAVSDYRSVRRPESAMSWQSSARYGGSWPSSDLWINSASLNSTRCRTGSQWSWRSTGVMCWRRPLPVTTRAAAFWTLCSRWNRSYEEQWVAVVQSAGHKRLHQCPDDVHRQWSGDWPQLPQLMIAAVTECVDVAWQTKLTVNNDALTVV